MAHLRRSKFPVLFTLNLCYEQHLTATYSSFRVLRYIKTLVTPTNAQLYNLRILCSNYLLHVSALSPSSGSLHQDSIKTYSNI
jgi:hypothetical protein